jgi:hypothetical protein
MSSNRSLLPGDGTATACYKPRVSHNQIQSMKIDLAVLFAVVALVLTNVMFLALSLFE